MKYEWLKTALLLFEIVSARWILNQKDFHQIWKNVFAVRTQALDGSSPPLIRSSTSRTSEVRNLNNKTTMILVVIFVAYSLQWLPYHLFTIATEVVRMHGDKNGLGAKVNRMTSRISETRNSVNSRISAIKGCHQSLICIYWERNFAIREIKN